MEKEEIGIKVKLKTNITYIILALLIIAQLSMFIYLFQVEKTAYYEDEFFSYALSNSYYKPFLYGSEFLQCDNYNVWLSGSDFYDYLTTNDQTNFQYDSVWYNQAEDVHPPLYYALLHTICSIFTGQFSWWYGFIINLICFVVTQIFLFKLFSNIGKSPIVGLICCAFWGFTISAQNTVLFIRMYAMLVMWTVIFLYLCKKIIDKGRVEKVKEVIPLACITFLGAMTQHFFLIFAFFFTFLSCIWFFCHKKIKTVMLYGGAILAGVIVSFVAFPATYNHLFGEKLSSSGEPDASLFYRFFLEPVFSQLFGYQISLYKSSFLNELFAYIIIIIAFAVPILFLIRQTKSGKIILLWLKKVAVYTINYIKKSDFFIACIAVASLSLIYVVADNVWYFDFNEYVDRYVFNIMPLVSSITVYVIYTAIKLILSLIKQVKKHSTQIAAAIVTIGVCIVLIVTNVKFDSQYIFKSELDNGKIKTHIKDSNCVMVISSSIFMPAFADIMNTVDKAYVTLYSNEFYKKQNEEYKKLLGKDKNIYLVIESNYLHSVNLTIDEVLDYYEEFYDANAVYVASECSHFCKLEAYKIQLN